MSMLVAHAGHWLTTVGFALAPLSVIAAIGVLAVREHRRENH